MTHTTSDPRGHDHDHTHEAYRGRPGLGPAPEHDTGLAHFLDLDAALGAPVLAAALDAASLALGPAPYSVVDLGAGTGTGSLALAARFPGARVHALEASPGMFDRLRHAAAAASFGDRVELHLVDLDDDWPAVLPADAADLAWAALSLHHVTDPGQVLHQVFEMLRPGGVFVVIEMTGTTTYAPADLGTGRDGLGERLVHALAAHGYPVTADWTTALTAARFAPVERHETTFAASARTTEGSRYLALQLTLSRDRLAENLPTDDLAALDSAIAALQAGTSSLALTSGRAVWIAVRPVAEHPLLTRRSASDQKPRPAHRGPQSPRDRAAPSDALPPAQR